MTQPGTEEYAAERRPLMIPAVVYDRLTVVKGELEGLNRARGKARPAVTYGELIEALLDNWDATARLAQGVATTIVKGGKK